MTSRKEILFQWMSNISTSNGAMLSMLREPFKNCMHAMEIILD
jgi:hypothetical protein